MGARFVGGVLFSNFPKAEAGVNVLKPRNCHLLRCCSSTDGREYLVVPLRPDHNAVPRYSTLAHACAYCTLPRGHVCCLGWPNVHHVILGGFDGSRHASGTVVGLPGTTVRGVDDSDRLHRYPPPLPVRIIQSTQQHSRVRPPCIAL